MPVDEDNMSIGAITGTKEERQRFAKKSVDFVCDQCGAIEKVIKDKIPALTSESSGISSIPKPPSEFETLLKGFAPAKDLMNKQID